MSNTEIKPCPFCGGEGIAIELQHDCYSSWGKAYCRGCYAYSECGTDKSNSAFPNAVENWRELTIKAWNTNVYKNVVKEIER